VGVAAVPWPPKRYGLPRKMPLYPDQWMVFKGQKYPKEAWELQSWLAGPEGMRLYSQGTGLLPARKSLAEAVRTMLKGYKPGITNTELEAVLNSVDYGHITPSHAIVNWPAIGDQAVNPVFQSLQLGHLTGKQAMEQMSAKIQAVLKQYPAPK
jgi:ABC-type glycerol-3-phosphate transport system substrate-binding protein